MSDPARSKRLDAFEAVLAKGSTDPFVSYARAMELRSLGRLGDALTAFGELEQRAPGYVPTYLMAAQVSRELGRVEDARGFAQRGVERARTAGDAHAASELEAFLETL